MAASKASCSHDGKFVVRGSTGYDITDYIHALMSDNDSVILVHNDCQ